MDEKGEEISCERGKRSFRIGKIVKVFWRENETF
jgi:hypothetical protein